MECVVCSSNNVMLNQAELQEQPYGFDWPEEHVFKDKMLAKCECCGSYFVQDDLEDHDLSEFYRVVYGSDKDNYYSFFDKYSARFYARYFSQALFLRQNAAIFTGMKVLEIGSNATSILPALNNFIKSEFYYYDQTESEIINSYDGIRLGNYFDASCVDESRYDLIVSSHSLEHINPFYLGRVVGSLYDSLSDGGYLFIEVPDDICRKSFHAPHTVFFTNKGLREMLRRFGFSIVSDISSPKSDYIGVGDTVNPDRIVKKVYRKVFSFIGPVLINLKKNNFINNFYNRLMLARAVENTKVLYDGRPYHRILVRKGAL